MQYGIDYTSLSVDEVKAVGASFVCRYVSTPGNPKNLTHSEAHELTANGVDLVVVFETTADRSLAGRNAGEDDAHHGLVQAIDAGMVGARPIFFAVDFDTAGSPHRTDAYFDGVAAVLGHHRCGPYGGIEVCEHQFSRGFQWAWQTYAWSDGKWGRAKLQQYLNGSSYDHDRGFGDFGQWSAGVPFNQYKAHDFSTLIPHERVEADRLVTLQKHPHIHEHGIRVVKARLTQLRKAVWRAAVHGETVFGSHIKKGWDIEHRRQRYHILSQLTDWPPRAANGMLV